MQTEGSEERRNFLRYLPDICDTLKLGNPDAPHVHSKFIDRLRDTHTSCALLQQCREFYGILFFVFGSDNVCENTFYIACVLEHVVDHAINICIILNKL